MNRRISQGVTCFTPEGSVVEVDAQDDEHSICLERGAARTAWQSTTVHSIARPGPCVRRWLPGSMVPEILDLG